MTLEDVGEAIAGHRAQRGLSLEEVAAIAHIDVERLCSAEMGELALDETELANVASALQTDVTAFFGGRQTPLSYLVGMG
jgi:transcriptional regulator with XRE-family HTH domain